MVVMRSGGKLLWLEAMLMMDLKDSFQARRGVHVCVYMCVCACVCVCVCMCICACTACMLNIHVCLCVYMCMFIQCMKIMHVFIERLNVCACPYMHA